MLAVSFSCLVAMCSLRAEFDQLKAVEAKAQEAEQQLQEKDRIAESLNKELEALKAKLALLDRY
jgi:hypothetical protein